MQCCVKAQQPLWCAVAGTCSASARGRQRFSCACRFQHEQVERSSHRCAPHVSNVHWSANAQHCRNRRRCDYRGYGAPEDTCRVGGGTSAKGANVAARYTCVWLHALHMLRSGAACVEGQHVDFVQAVELVFRLLSLHSCTSSWITIFATVSYLDHYCCEAMKLSVPPAAQPLLTLCGITHISRCKLGTACMVLLLPVQLHVQACS